MGLIKYLRKIIRVARRTWAVDEKIWEERYGFRRKRWYAYRHKKTGRFVATKMWRYSYAINYVIHARYYGIIGQAAVKKRTAIVRRDLEDWLQRKVIEKLEEILGWDESEWWFDSDNTIEEYIVEAQAGEAWQLIEYDKKLFWRWEIRNENDKGKTIRRHGRLQRWRGKLPKEFRI